MDLIELNEQNENVHPWEISRTKSILKILNKNNTNVQYADIGAGDLYFTKHLIELTTKPIYAVDNNFFNLKADETIIKYNDINSIPDNSVDYALLMDVLEHVEYDMEFFRTVLKKLKREGKILITVPAFQFLFSEHDAFLRHYRRYNRKRLRALFEKNNVQEMECFYFYSTLFLIRLLQLFFSKVSFKKRNKQGIGSWKLNKKNIITILLTECLNLDFLINRLLGRLKISFFGLSLCILVKKIN